MGAEQKQTRGTHSNTYRLGPRLTICYHSINYSILHIQGCSLTVCFPFLHTVSDQKQEIGWIAALTLSWLRL